MKTKKQYQDYTAVDIHYGDDTVGDTVEKVYARHADSEDGCENTAFGYICTRSKGHKGPHVAHGIRSAVALWERIKPAKKTLKRKIKI